MATLTGAGHLPIRSTRTSMVRNLGAPSEDAWRAFVLVYAPLMRAWIRARGVPNHSVDDVLQDCFTSVFHGITHFVVRRERRGAFRGWLRTIAHRRSADYFRRQQGQVNAAQNVLAEIPNREQQTAEQLEAEEKALREVEARALHLIRQSTSERTWKMFWQTAIENRSTEEVAAEFNVSTAAVRVAKKRVLDRLKAIVID